MHTDPPAHSHAYFSFTHTHTHTHTHTQNQLLGPGTYSTETGDFTPRAIEQKRGGPNWERAHEVARLAAIPHMLYRQQWEHKRLLVGHASFPAPLEGPGNKATGGSCLVPSPPAPWRGLGTRLLVDTACNQDSAVLELTNKRNVHVRV